MAAAVLALQGSVAAQIGTPRLKYEAPAQLLHSALTPPEVYESTVVNASIHIYRFRPATGVVVPRFQQTLLREWIAPQDQEAQLAAPPSFGALAIAGAAWRSLPNSSRRFRSAACRGRGCAS